MSTTHDGPMVMVIDGGTVAHLTAGSADSLCGSEVRWSYASRPAGRTVSPHHYEEHAARRLPICKRCTKVAERIAADWQALEVIG